MPEPYAPCPCGSGEKFKFCCKSKGMPAEAAPASHETAAQEDESDLDPLMAYIEPLLEGEYGSPVKMQQAAQMGMFFWELALMNPADAEKALDEMFAETGMTAVERGEFRRDLMEPMIRRHREMFPDLDPARRQMVRNEPPPQEGSGIEL